MCDLICQIKSHQEKMRGQRGRLPVQTLGYVNSTKVILGLSETAGVHFLLRPHHYILKVITQFRNGGPRANMSMEASFTGILERNGISWWVIRGIYIFTTCWSKMAHADGRKCSSEWSTKTTKRSGWTCYKSRGGYHGLCPVAFWMQFTSPWT